MIDDRGAKEKSVRLLDLIRTSMIEALPKLAEDLQVDVLARAPTEDQEYTALMMGGEGEPLVPREGQRSGDTDGRTRFDKGDKLYIIDAVRAPVNVEAEADGLRLKVRVGNLAWLEQNSFFEYTNLRYNGPKQQPTESGPFIQGPYFEAFEAGAPPRTIVPKHALGNGHAYPLKPGEGKDGERDSMTKSIAPHFMFARELLDVVATVTISTTLAKVGPGKETTL